MGCRAHDHIVKGVHRHGYTWEPCDVLLRCDLIVPMPGCAKNRCARDPGDRASAHSPVTGIVQQGSLVQLAYRIWWADAWGCILAFGHVSTTYVEIHVFVVVQHPHIYIA